MTPMDDVEAVAREIDDLAWYALELEVLKKLPTDNRKYYERVISAEKAEKIIETLKSRGWTPPSEGKM